MQIFINTWTLTHSQAKHILKYTPWKNYDEGDVDVMYNGIQLEHWGITFLYTKQERFYIFYFIKR